MAFAVVISFQLRVSDLGGLDRLTIADVQDSPRDQSLGGLRAGDPECGQNTRQNYDGRLVKSHSSSMV
jgi:hypothetical protein